MKRLPDKTRALLRTIGARRPVTRAENRTRRVPGKRSRAVVGDVTTDDLAAIVSLACYVIPRSDEEQLVLLKAATELDGETGSTLADEVHASAGAPQRDLQLPTAKVAGVLAVGGAMAASWRVLSHLRSRRRNAG